MPSRLPRALRRWAEDPSFAVYLVTVVLCLLRARRPAERRASAWPARDLSIGPADLALARRGRSCASAAARARDRARARRCWARPLAFAALVVVSALAERRRRRRRAAVEARRALRSDARRGRLRRHAGAARCAARGRRRVHDRRVARGVVEFVGADGRSTGLLRRRARSRGARDPGTRGRSRGGFTPAGTSRRARRRRHRRRRRRRRPRRVARELARALSCCRRDPRGLASCGASSALGAAAR